MSNSKKIVTLDDVAQRAKVSKMTVSRVLSGKGPVAIKTRERINELIKELDYQPNLLARSLSSKQTMIVGVVVNKRDHMFMVDYTTKIISGIMDVALRHQYQLMLCPVSSEDDVRGEYLRLIRSKMLDGLILLKRKQDDPYIQELVEAKFPFVMLNYKKYSQDINFVDAKNKQGAIMATEYLYSKGHREIAFMGGRVGETNSNDRLSGYKEALKKLGLKYRAVWVIHGEYHQEVAYRECGKLLDMAQRPTAIFCADDNMAIGVIKRLRESGLKIPQDMAVIGFDDIQIASMIRPALTTIRQPIYDIGKTGMQTLLNIINGTQQKAVHRLLPVELVERESV